MQSNRLHWSFRFIALPVFAATAFISAAMAQERAMEARKAFPFLEAYLELPRAERDAFRPAYYLIAKSGGLAGVQVWIQVGAQRLPASIGRDGRFLLTPSVDQLRQDAHVVFHFPEGVKAGVRLKLELATPVSNEVRSDLLDHALAQATAGMRRVAGVKGLLAPPLRRAVFVGAQGAEISDGNGARHALPLRDGEPFYSGDVEHKAGTITFRAPPRAVQLDTAQ